MSQQEKGKNIFEKARDAVSNRDEKEAIEAAMNRAEELEKRSVQADQKAAQTAQKLAEVEQRAAQATQKLTEAERKVTQLSAELAKAQSELASNRQELNSVKNTVTVIEQRMAATHSELQKYVSAEQAKKITEAAAASAQAQTIAEHTIKADETLSHLAQKYYGSAGEAYWRLIYTANKDVIGDNPGRVRPGMVVKIPVLPEEMKKK